LKQRGLLSRQADIRQVTGASSVTISRPEEQVAGPFEKPALSLRLNDGWIAAKIDRFCRELI
jgi:hypothetical protein